jgi:para-nitrobenzyl esterase
MIRVVLLSSCVVGTVLANVPPAAGHDRGSENGPVVETAEGPVRGFSRDGVYEFLGIPYAFPPVGALRWMPPQLPARWTAPRDATNFGHTCPQITELGPFAGPASVTEDCLFLNVFTTGFARNKKGNAVLVWIHGGGNYAGESNDYDASKLATGGPLGTPTVVVTLNYRLGLLGFLAHPALDKKGYPFANYGILDIQAALYWVRRNIKPFGGDPNRVALGGQSAGAIDTGANLISPLAAGLFNRAIFQSGPEFGIASLSAGLTAGTAFANAAGCPGEDEEAAQCLRRLSASRILQLQGGPHADGPYASSPMVDGTIIPILPEQAYATGRFNKMPIMGGTAENEETFSNAIAEYFSGPPRTPMTADKYEAMIHTELQPELSAKVLAEYPVSNYPSPQLAASAVHTDEYSACEARHVVHLWSQFVPVYQHEFRYQGAPFYFPQMPGFVPLASHTIDLQFLFRNWHGGNLGVNLDQASGQPRELNALETQLSDRMVAYYTNFAKTGNPNKFGVSLWPQFTDQSGALAILSDNAPNLSAFTDAQFAVDHHCAFWDPILGFSAK